MSLDHHVDIGVLRQHFGQVADGARAVRVNFETARTEQQFVVHRDVYVAVADRDRQSLAFEAGQRVGHFAADGVDRLLAAFKHPFEFGHAADAVVQRHLLVLEFAQHPRRFGGTVGQQLLITFLTLLQVVRQARGVGNQLHFLGRQFVVQGPHIFEAAFRSGQFPFQAQRFGFHRIEFFG